MTLSNRADEKAREGSHTTDSGLEKSNLSTNSGDVDEALQAFKGFENEELEIDEATSKRLVRRIDLFLMPIMCVCYGLNYLDKTTLSYASVTGIVEDINLQGDDYSWLGSMFYFGYLAWEFPAGRLMQRLPLAKYNAANIICWGTVLCLFSAVTNFSGAVAIRFFLGVFEASVTLGFALITSQWYTKREQAARVALWVSFNGLAQVFGGTIAYGIAAGSVRHGFSLAPWKIIFLFTGLLTIVMGIVSSGFTCVNKRICEVSILNKFLNKVSTPVFSMLTLVQLFLIMLPDNQLNAWWLTQRDRALAVERVRSNQQGIGNKKFKWHQFKESFKDPVTWMFALLTVTQMVANGGLSNFFNRIVVSFGYTKQQSLLYATPAGAIQFITLCTWGYISQTWGNRLVWSAGGVAASLLGMILIVALPIERPLGRLLGYYLTNCFTVGFVAIISLVSSNVAGYTKKTTVGVVFLVSYCVGNIIGPQTFRPEHAPQYIPAEITIIVMYAFNVVGLVLLSFYYRWQNKKKAALRSSSGYEKTKDVEWLDLTDWENPEFVYEY